MNAPRFDLIVSFTSVVALFKQVKSLPLFVIIFNPFSNYCFRSQGNVYTWKQTARYHSSLFTYWNNSRIEGLLVDNEFRKIYETNEAAGARTTDSVQVQWVSTVIYLPQITPYWCFVGQLYCGAQTQRPDLLKVRARPRVPIIHAEEFI